MQIPESDIDQTNNSSIILKQTSTTLYRYIQHIDCQVREFNQYFSKAFNIQIILLSIVVRQKGDISIDLTRIKATWNSTPYDVL